MSKYLIDIDEINNCNAKLDQAKELFNTTTEKATPFFQSLLAEWEGQAADSFAFRFMTLNTQLKKSTSVLDTLRKMNEDVKNEFIEADKVTKHVDPSLLVYMIK